MEPNYYVTTLMNAGMKLGPPLLFIVVGYFIFIKLPFLFLKKNMAEQKKKLQEENKDLALAQNASTSASAAKTLPHQQNKTAVDKPKLQALPSEPQKQQKRPEPRAEQKTEQKTEQKKKEEPKKYTPPPQSGQSPEEVLGFRPNESFTKGELKKRYFDKLKENHPDRVASMGEDFKKLAEKNTKEINKAYDKLKNRAA